MHNREFSRWVRGLFAVALATMCALLVCTHLSAMSLFFSAVADKAVFLYTYLQSAVFMLQ